MADRAKRPWYLKYLSKEDSIMENVVAGLIGQATQRLGRAVFDKALDSKKVNEKMKDFDEWLAKNAGGIVDVGSVTQAAVNILPILATNEVYRQSLTKLLQGVADSTAQRKAEWPTDPDPRRAAEKVRDWVFTLAGEVQTEPAKKDIKGSNEAAAAFEALAGLDDPWKIELFVKDLFSFEKRERRLMLSNLRKLRKGDITAMALCQIYRLDTPGEEAEYVRRELLKQLLTPGPTSEEKALGVMQWGMKELERLLPKELEGKMDVYLEKRRALAAVRCTEPTIDELLAEANKPWSTKIWARIKALF